MSALKVPAGHGESEYIEKRSSFLGIVEPVSSEEEARAVIAAVKKQHRDARHNCWCYLIQGGAERYSDDGEPQGTAGIPMLEVFRKAGVSNAVCVVTRYFGGVLLGAGGLLRAYTKAAKDALENSGITEVIPVRELTLRCPYSLLERIRLEIAAAEAEILSTDYAADITLSIRIPEAKAVSFSERIFDLTSGTIKKKKKNGTRK